VHEAYPIREIINVSIFGSSAGAFLVLMAVLGPLILVTATRGSGKSILLYGKYIYNPYYDNSS
jgi:hypothetical protein